MKGKGKSVQAIVADIKALRIQGASRVRKAAVQALKNSILSSRRKTVGSFRQELKKNMLALLRSRPTEPGMRTAMRVLLGKSKEPLSLDELKKSLVKACSQFEADRQQSLKAIAEKGAKLLRKKAVVFTHCHSHTVEDILKLAWKKKMLKAVYCTETRPLFQGRITAKNLSKAGIPVTHFVDSAAAIYLKECDLVLIGVDAFIADGSIANKVGSLGIALLAHEYGVPVYVAGSSHKFDPLTFYGKNEEIEVRGAEEVWPGRPKKVRIENPAFDVVPAKLLKGFVTEKGVFAPKAFAKHMAKELKLAGKSAKEISLACLLKQ